MNEIFQAKVLLTLYKNLQGAIRENEKKVLKCAARGFYTHGADDTMKLYEKIIEMNSEKIKLLNLKVLIDKALHLMLKEDVRFIVLRFFKGMKFIDIGNDFNVSLRQVFRLYDRATESFKNQLQYLKYTPERIEEEFGDIPLYRETAFRLSNKYGILD